MRGQIYSPEFRADAVKQVMAHAAKHGQRGSIAAVARALDLKNETLRGWLLTQGKAPSKHTPRTNGTMTPEQRAERERVVEEGRRAGLTMDQIAAQLGLSAKTLAWWLRNQEVIRTERQAKRRQSVTRNCLRCGNEFQSEGAHNRLCSGCRALSHMDSPYTPNPGGGTGKRVMARRA